MGSSSVPSPQVAYLARETGRLIAGQGAILITGATTGLPFYAAHGANEANGQVIGFSPAIDLAEHERMGLPLQYHDMIIYTGLGSHGRNLLNVRASDALVFIGGSMGALNEFTIAYDENKIIGILEGSGGFCNHMKDWIVEIRKPNNRSILHYASEPARLIDDVFRSIQARSSGDVEFP